MASHPVMVFSKTTCPFCDKVKAMFAGLNVTVEYLELDKIGGFILGTLSSCWRDTCCWTRLSLDISTLACPTAW